jgi:23S rRNA (uridine2552-2'-O)-methyltransferase
VRERKEDAYWRLAKRSGYRSRAAFKLQQIDARYGVLGRGFIVVDLGCAPGGWSQVAAEAVGTQGAVIGVDLSRVTRLKGVAFLRGDITDPKTIEAVQSEVGRSVARMKGARGRAADAVLSDMSPNISGVYSVDQAKSLVLAGRAFGAASKLLHPGGHFVVKVFEGEDFHPFLQEVRQAFAFVKVHAPPASRKQSSEIYIVAKGFRPPPGRKRRAVREEE